MAVRVAKEEAVRLPSGARQVQEAGVICGREALGGGCGVVSVVFTSAQGIGEA